MNGTRFISYLRVSTKKQGAEGLGIEAQRTAVSGYLKNCQGIVLKEFVEVESGAKNNRKELAEALRLCALTSGKLLIAKLDRLSRDAGFLLNLMKSGVKFVAVDNPHANDLTVGILALVAQHEREMIRSRIKAALAEAKKRGTKLGNHDGGKALQAYIKQHGTGHALMAIKEKTDKRAQDLKIIIDDIKEGGVTSRHGIARELMERGILTARGRKKWYAKSVSNVLARLS